MNAVTKPRAMLRASWLIAMTLMAGIAQAAFLIEAENATRTSDLVVATDVAGYSGSGFVSPFSAAGAKVTATFSNVPAGSYDVHLHYHAYGAQQNFVSINGGASQDVHWPATQGVGTGWSDVVLPGVSLSAGANTVAVSKGWGYIDLDYIQLVPVSAALVEAENATRTSDLVVANDISGYSGTGFVNPFSAAGAAVTATFNNVSSGAYDVHLRYHSYLAQQNFVSINGATPQDVTWPATQGIGTGWNDVVLSGVQLNAGTNTVTVSKGWGYIDLDYFQLVPAGQSSSSGWGNDPSIPLTLIAPSNSMPDFLQVGNSSYAYWIEDGVWGAQGLTRGTYTNNSGTQYETAYGRSSTVGANGEVAWRSAWKWPTGTTEVKAYPSAIFGAKPGFYNTSNTPGGYHILLPNGTYAQTAPSGATPGNFMPLPANGALPTINASFTYNRLVTPSGRGQLTFDIWLQSTPQQVNGFSAPPISHEIMIPVDYWGNYGAYGYRNPGWYSHDVTLNGLLWHVYFVRNFAGGWTFVVFEPDAPLGAGVLKTLNLSAFLNHITTRYDSNGQPWAAGTESLVSVELGVEPVEGVGDMKVSNYRVWKP